MNTNRIPIWFAGIAIFFGTAMVFLTPPFQVADEFWHFFRAYQVSLGQFVAQSQGNTQGGILPFSLLRLANRFAKLPGHPTERTSLKAILDARQIALDPDRVIFCNFPSSANYSPIVYAPQALAIAIGRWAGFNPLALLYLGREAALLAWTLAGYFTLRLVPALRPAVMILMLMPMTLSLAASVSADGMTIALSLLFTALIWRCAIGQEGSVEIDRRTKIAIFLLSVAVALCKFVYLPLIFMVLLIPPIRFGGSRPFVRFVTTLTIINVLASAAWLSRSPGARLVLRPDHPEVDVSRQLAFVRDHPIAFPDAMAKGFAHDGLFILQSFVGILGWIDNPASPVVVGLYLLALMAASIPMRSDPPAPEAWRLAIVAAAVCATVVAFAFLNYLVWTPVGYWYVQGIQGRYFIPLGLAVLVLIWGIMRRHPRLIPARPDLRQINLIATGLCVSGCVYAICLVFERYFNAR